MVSPSCAQRRSAGRFSGAQLDTDFPAPAHLTADPCSSITPCLPRPSDVTLSYPPPRHVHYPPKEPVPFCESEKDKGPALREEAKVRLLKARGSIDGEAWHTAAEQAGRAMHDQSRACH